MINKDCKVRACVISRGLQNCALCERYPCVDLEKKFVERHTVEERFGGPMPEQDYRLFVRPYEGRQVLDNVRQRQGKQ